MSYHMNLSGKVWEFSLQTCFQTLSQGQQQRFFNVFFTSTHMDVLMLKSHYEKIQQACSVSFAYADDVVKVGDTLAIVHQTNVVCSKRQSLQEREVNLQTSSDLNFSLYDSCSFSVVFSSFLDMLTITKKCNSSWFSFIMFNITQLCHSSISANNCMDVIGIAMFNIMSPSGIEASHPRFMKEWARYVVSTPIYSTHVCCCMPSWWFEP